MARKKLAAKKGSGKKRLETSVGLRDEEATIAWLREMMREFLREREWEKFHLPRNLAASVAVEAGELLELFQWLTPEEAGGGAGRMRCSGGRWGRRCVT